MNVLLFVFSLLLALTALTYSRLHTFQTLALERQEYRTYVHDMEKDYYNDQATTAYEESKGGGKGETGGGGSQLNSKIAFQWVLDREENWEGADVVHLWFKRLISLTYSNTVFYQSYLAEVREDSGRTEADLLDLLLEILLTQVDIMKDQGKKVSKPKYLARIPIEDEELKNLFNKMLAGSEGVLEGDRLVNAYPSLLNFLGNRKNSGVSVYLAKEEILLAIFDNPRLVQEIIDKRSELYQLVKDEVLTTEEASQELKDLLGGLRVSEHDEKLLDFGVSKTEPPKRSTFRLS